VSHHLLLVLHLLAATIWVGGHMLLCFRFLPKALKEKNVEVIRDFEKQYEPIGIPSLVILIITGIMMAYDYDVTFTKWFSFSNGIEKVVSVKLLLLVVTLGLAIHARFFIIPKLSVANLKQMAVHIIVLTTITITMLVFGSFVRIGGV
jgi:putative copper export protein